MNTHGQFVFNGENYELSHLNTFLHKFIQEAKGNNPERVYECIIEFSHHCFTKSPNSHTGENLDSYPADLHYVTSKETRVFCFERYDLSFKLPNLIRDLHTLKCFFSKDNKKFLTFKILNRNEQEVDYLICFSLTKINKKIRIFIRAC